MKKTSLAVIILLLTVVSSAQNQIAVFAGPQMSGASYTIFDKKQKTDHKYGFHAGMHMKTPFEGNLYFTPTVFYSLKGYEVTFTEFSTPPDPDAINNNTNIHTFEMATLLQYDFSNKPGHMFIKAGPSFDLLLTGREKFETKTSGTVSRNMKFGFQEYGHFSANILLQLGYETAGGFLVFAQYTHGLANISNFDEGPKIRNRVYGLSIGKYINWKKLSMDTKNVE